MKKNLAETIEKNNLTQKNTYGALQLTEGSEGYDSSQKWLVKKFIPEASFGVFFAASASLKTFVTIELACSIVTGSDFANYSVKEGAVLYIAAEGASGVSKRIKAWEIENNKAAKNLFVLGQSLIISEKESKDNINEAIQEIEAHCGVKVRLVIIDTIARCYTGDENSSQHMSAFISSCDDIKEKSNVTVLCVHHTGTNESKGARGSSALIGACDFEFTLKRRNKEKTVQLINTKQKDAEEAPTLEIEFGLIDIGIVCDENQPITSLVKIGHTIITPEDPVKKEDPTIKIINEDFLGRTTRGQLKNILFPSATTLTEAQRQKFGRDLKNLQSLKKINIDQKNPNRAGDNDIISIIV